MLDALNTAFILLAGGLAVPALVVFVQVLAANLSGRVSESTIKAKRPAAIILMPAHNEAAGIASSVSNLRTQMAAGDRLVVIADNCTDDTGVMAEAAGAEVMVRTNPDLRGKGYALDFGVKGVAGSQGGREVVVVLDADCTLGPNGLDQLVRACLASKRPVQALNLMHSPPGAGVGGRLGELAWLLRNKVRPMGWHALGLPCQLMGTGMALPFRHLQGARLASSEIVEDMKLGIDLAIAGSAPLFCPQAQVHSMFPVRSQDLSVQRNRWERGHLGMIRYGVPRLLVAAARQRSLTLLAMALDLCVPPLALLVLLLLAGLVGSAALSLSGISVWPTIVFGLSILLLGLAVLLTWHRYCQHLLSLAELTAIPLYIARKLPTYGSAMLRQKVNWIRTARDAPNSATNSSRSEAHKD